MIWLARVMILMLIVLQPLRGLAAVEHCHGQGQHAATLASLDCDHDEQSAHGTAGMHHDHGDHDHCKCGETCCGSCSAGIAGSLPLMVAAAVPSMAIAYGADHLPASPHESTLRPPIA